MSLLRDYQFRELTSFGGAWLLQDPSTVPVTAALRSRNVEFVSGMVGVRKGFQTIINAGGNPLVAVSAVEMYAMYAPFPPINTLDLSDVALVTADYNSGISTLTVTATPLLLRNAIVSGGLSSSVVTSTAVRNASFVSVGMRLYGAYTSALQAGIGIGGVASGYNSTGTLLFLGDAVTNLFLGPSTYAPATSEPAAGVVTAGIHRLGYLIEYASGFTTRVSPDAGSVQPSLTSFTPISVTAAGSKNLRATITNTWGSEVVAISLVMTTVTNLNQYYIVPGTRTAVSASFTITFSISDADLSSQGIDATPYLYWLTQWASASGVAAPSNIPFTTRHVALLGDRMGYLATANDGKGNAVDALYVSERNNYQAITADQHLVQIPGQRPMTTMFRMGGMNYLAGPHELYGVTDNGDVPATWAAPTMIDGRHGTLATHGVEVASSGNYAWIADQGGLFLFTGGPITSLPVSYQQTSDWSRINWTAAYCVKIKDDAANKRVHVLVPLDGATSPSHKMVFDYTNGTTFEAVMYSLDNITGYSMGSMELIRNPLFSQASGNKQKIELWLGSSASGQYLRQVNDLDTNPYRDTASAVNIAINAAYRTCPLPGRDQAGGVISLHHGFHARIKGAGAITPTVYDIDAVRSFTCRAVTLATAPDADILCAADLRGELAFVEFATNTVDTHWQLAYLKYYHSPYLMQR